MTTFPKLPSNCIPAELSTSRGVSTVRFSITKPERMSSNNTTSTDSNKWKKAILKLMMIIDEGVYEYNGTFGVVISNGTNAVVTNKGQIYSANCLQSAY